VGTTGWGAELGFGFNELLAVRGSYGAGSFDYTFSESDIDYRTKVKPSIGLLTSTTRSSRSGSVTASRHQPA
jgi:hypothetical protein